MTDVSTPTVGSAPAGRHTDEGARARLKKRYAAEARFRLLGAGAVAIAALFLIILLSTIVTQAIPAFRMNYALLMLDLQEDRIDAQKPEGGDYDAIIRESFSVHFPEVTGRHDRRALRGLISAGAAYELRDTVIANADMIGTTPVIGVPLDDFADLYFKGLIAQEQERITLSAPLAAIIVKGDAEIPGRAELYDMVASRTGVLPDENGVIEIGDNDPTVLLEDGNSVLKLVSISALKMRASVLGGMSEGRVAPDEIRVIATPQNQRKISDREIVWLDRLDAAGLIESRWNTTFLFTGASREPEMAGIWGAVVGSFLTLAVTLALCFPIGVGAAVYLEEFAPKNRWTQFIEVNINNLAAVPSIVFGLLGLAVFLGFFALPRSAALVGGMVLALMTLPTVIIAARAALRAVPPSIREGALGVGASRLQTVTHHVLPLAMPGIMTGTIIGMAQALGETAPLLMIGMVAFIVDIPGGFTDPATVLPVQIFMWADFPEPAFRQKTAAAILVLLAFLVIMNAAAVMVRRRFERRW